MSDNEARTLSAFIAYVRVLRDTWRVESHKELWFRGEGKPHPTSVLRPKLYRPRSDAALRPFPELLKIEYDLHEAFQHGAVQLLEWAEDENWNWNSYFLMQHHEAPTRLLDWSDGALIALHFALRNKDNDKEGAIVYVLEPYRMMDQLDALPERAIVKDTWKRYVAAHRSSGFDEDEWETPICQATQRI